MKRVFSLNVSLHYHLNHDPFLDHLRFWLSSPVLGLLYLGRLMTTLDLGFPNFFLHFVQFLVSFLENKKKEIGLLLA